LTGRARRFARMRGPAPELPENPPHDVLRCDVARCRHDFRIRFPDHAGVDHIARFSKMRVFRKDGERLIVTLSSGNLSITQNALSMLEQRVRLGDDELHFYNAPSMFDAARILGDALREVKAATAPI